MRNEELHGEHNDLRSAPVFVMIILLVALGASLSPPTSGTADYYVSPTGRNSNPCTQSAPCADPAYVVNKKAIPGDTIQAASGTYDYGSGSADFTASGTAGKYITIICASRGTCKIQNSVTGNHNVVGLLGNYQRFMGFEVVNTSSSGNNLGLYVTGSHLVISQNTIHHIEPDCTATGGGGIQTNGSAGDLVIDSNLIYDIGWQNSACQSAVQVDGILVETPQGAKQITNNIIYHVSGGWGIGYGANGTTTSPVVISNNTVFSNGQGGIEIDNGSDYTTVSNNIVLNNGMYGGRCGIRTVYANDAHILITNNDVYGNAGGDYCSAGSPIKSANISVNPALGTTFVNWQADGSGDYHPKLGSPTIDAGRNSCAPGSPAYISPGVCAPLNAYDGVSRPQGSSWDIGAYEYR